MTTELARTIPARAFATGGSGFVLPAVIADQGDKAAERFFTYFTDTILNTRAAYYRNAMRFFTWTHAERLSLPAIKSYHVSAYLDELATEHATPTVKQHLAAIRMCFDWLLTSGGIMDSNPASSVHGPKHVVKQGKTPVLNADEAKQLLASIIPNEKQKDGTVSGEDNAQEEGPKPTIAQLRDRALIAVMVFSFARVSAALAMKVEDYYTEGRRAWLRLHEKGGKRHEVPAHHNAEDYLDAYIAAAGIGADRKTPLFRSIDRHRQLTARPMHRIDAWRMIKHRSQAIGLPEEICNHTFRATGITAYLENGGTIEHAQQIANHESPKTTKLYDRTSDEITLDEVERIMI